MGVRAGVRVGVRGGVRVAVRGGVRVGVRCYGGCGGEPLPLRLVDASRAGRKEGRKLP